MQDLQQTKPQPLLDREQAAAYLGVAPNTLAVWACTGRYELPFVRVGRLAKYRLADLDAWLEQRVVAAAP
jgi:excisionase family DNA binding protein